MKIERVCQSCGMPLKNEEDFGTTKDGRKDDDYCTYCYQHGKFTKGYTMKEMIDHNLDYLEEFNKEANTNFDKTRAREEMLKFFPSLKRWQ